MYNIEPSGLIGSLGFFMRWVLAFILAIVMCGCGRADRADGVERADGVKRMDRAVGAVPDRPTSAGRAHLVVHVVDLNTRNGQLLFCVFKSADGFPGDSRLAVNSQIKPVASDDTFVLDLPPGTYAVAVVHDENSNGKLDTNFLGIPKEGYGVSNNPKPRRRGVNYPESAFKLPGDGLTLTVSMQYDFF